MFTDIISKNGIDTFIRSSFARQVCNLQCEQRHE